MNTPYIHTYNNVKSIKTTVLVRNGKKTNPKSGVSEVYQRSNDYNGLYIDAILTTKSIYSGEDLFFLKKSFENPLDAGVVKFEKAFSGDHVFSNSSLICLLFKVNSLSSPSSYSLSYGSFLSSKGKFTL